MMHLSNINRTDNCWNQFGIEYLVWDVFMYFYFLSLFLMQPTTDNLLITKLVTRKKIGPMKYPREKKFGPAKYPLEKVLDPRNSGWNYEIMQKLCSYIS